MFFCITKSQQLEFSFNQTHNANDFYVHTDAGWSHIIYRSTNYIYKGYVEDGTLKTKILEDDFADLKGNYCVIAVKGKELIVYHSDCRSFPIYLYSDKLSNINYNDEKQTFYSDAVLSIDSDFNHKYTHKDAIGDITNTVKTEDAVIDEIDQIISNSFENFLKHNTDPVKIWLSAGADTTLLYSYLQKYSNNYEVLNYTHFYYDKFWCCNRMKVLENWSYKQLHHFREDCVLVSGAPGDEFMMRNPNLVNLYLMYYDINIVDFLRNNDSMYHTRYFLKDKNIKSMYEQKYQIAQMKNLNEVEMKKKICNMLISDYQHHHIGYTLTFTPLRDINITKLLMQLPVESLLKQASDAYITKKLIERNNPKLLDIIAPNKNVKEHMCQVQSLLT